jgi:hypothetical protein
MSGIEVRVYDGAHPQLELAILEGAAGMQWTDIYLDLGTGRCELAASDPKASLAVEGNLIKFCLAPVPGAAPVPVFAYFIEAPVQAIQEGAESKWTLSGYSVLNYTSYAAIYPPGGWAAPTASVRSWVAATPGTVLKTLIDEAQARGAIPVMTYDFDATYDSGGNAWTANLNFTADCATTTLLDAIKQLMAWGIGIYMDPDKLCLHAYAPGKQGIDRSADVVWQAPNIRNDRPLTSTGARAGMKTVCLVKGPGGVFSEQTDAAGNNYISNPLVGRREGGLDFSAVSGDPTQMALAGQQQIALTEAASQAIDVPLTHGPRALGLYEPYTHYGLGDKIALNVGPYSQVDFQVFGITVAATTGADYTVDANLGAVVLDGEAQLRQLIASVSGNGGSTGGTVAGNLTLTNPKGFPGGPSFPLNPTVGMVWFRIDLGQWYYYDGTRWLSETLHLADLSPWGLGIGELTATGAEMVGNAWYGAISDIWIVSSKITFYINGGTALSGSHYWIVAVSTGGGTIATHTINSGASNAWRIDSQAVGALWSSFGSAPRYDVQGSATKTGTPGGLWVRHGLAYRTVAT